MIRSVGLIDWLDGMPSMPDGIQGHDDIRGRRTRCATPAAGSLLVIRRRHDH
jgi:hypothetical protein